jgi:hypothetical protein
LRYLACATTLVFAISAAGATAVSASDSLATKTVTVEVAGHGEVVLAGARPVACYPFTPRANQLGVPPPPKGRGRVLCGLRFVCSSSACGRVLRFPAGARITTTEIPSEGWYFNAWYGACRYGNWTTNCTRPPVAAGTQGYWGVIAHFQLPVPLGQGVEVGAAPGVVSSEVTWYQRVNASSTSATAPGRLPAPSDKTYLVVESSVAYTTTTPTARVDWKAFAFSGTMLQPRLLTMDPANGQECGTRPPGVIGTSTIASVPPPTASGQWATFDDYFLVPSSCINAYVLDRGPQLVSVPAPPGVTTASGFAVH